MRIAVILGKMNGGGVEQLAVNYFEAVDKSRLGFDFFCFEGGNFVPEEKIKALGGRVFFLPTLKHPLKYISSLKALLRENRYDAAHCHLSTLSAPALYAAKKAGVRVRIVHNHSSSGGKRELVRNFAKLLLKLPARIFATDYFACSEYAAKWMFGNIPARRLETPELQRGSARKRVVILPNAIDAERFKFSEKKRAEIRAEFNIPENALLFGHIGRFCPQKNQSFLIEIFEEICGIHGNSRLILAGTGPDLDMIRRLAENSRFGGRIVFAGQRSDPEALYSAFDCFILPSCYEGLPIVGVEAQCAGLPCLFSDKISAEAKLTESAQFIPLNASAAEWAKRAAEAGGKRNPNGAEQISEKGFDIRKTAELLAEFYLTR